MLYWRSPEARSGGLLEVTGLEEAYLGKIMYYFDNYSVNTYKTVHRTRLIGVFLLEIIGMSEKVPIYAYEK